MPSRIRSLLRPLVISGAAAILGFFPLMGLPGAIWMAMADPLAQLLWGERYRQAYSAAGSAVWPAAIYGALLQPLALAPVWWVTAAIWKGQRTRRRWLVMAAVLLLWSIALGLWLNWLILDSYGPQSSSRE